MKPIQKKAVCLCSQNFNTSAAFNRCPFSRAFFMPLPVKITTAVLFLCSILSVALVEVLANREMYSRFSVLLNAKTSITMNQNETAHPCNQLPETLLRATKLMGEAHLLIEEFHRNNPDFDDCIREDVLKAQDLLTDSAYKIGNLINTCFIATYFFFEWKEGAL